MILLTIKAMYLFMCPIGHNTIVWSPNKAALTGTLVGSCTCRPEYGQELHWRGDFVLHRAGLDDT